MELAGFPRRCVADGLLVETPEEKEFYIHPLNEIGSICISFCQKSIWRIYIWKSKISVPCI